MRVMIEAKDMRIGNWIKDIEGYDLLFRVEARHIARSEGFPCFRPIPLEDEHFRRFGFELDHGDWTLGGVRIGEHEEWEGEQTFRLSIHEWVSFGGRDIQYVHQLQNLFYALTGEELIYKP